MCSQVFRFFLHRATLSLYVLLMYSKRYGPCGSMSQGGISRVWSDMTGWLDFLFCFRGLASFSSIQNISPVVNPRTAESVHLEFIFNISY